MPFYFLYLHGFNGSPYGVGVLELKTWLKETFPEIIIEAPELAQHSINVIGQLSNLLDNASCAKKILFGNSMGGLLAHILKQNRDDISKVILLNPALNFKKIMVNFPQKHTCSRTGESIIITDKMIEQVDQLIPKTATSQEDYLLLLQEDDEVCDYQDTLDLLPNAKANIQSGQGHHYDDITKAFEIIRTFLS